MLERATTIGDPVGGRFLISGANNDYTGNTVVNGRPTGSLYGYAPQAQLILGADNALGNSGSLTLNTAELLLNGFSQTLSDIRNNGLSSRIRNGSNVSAGSLIIDLNSASVFSGVIGGSESNDNSLSVTKNGSGAMTFSGANTYTGDTIINAGTLNLQGSAFSTAARNYSISQGATLNLQNNQYIAIGTTSLSGGGTLIFSEGTLSNEAGSGRNVNMSLHSGAVIILQNFSLTNGGWQSFNWSGNRAGMQISSTSTLDFWDGYDITVDSLNGSGSITKNYGSGQTSKLNIGIADGSGTFSGIISNSHGTVAVTKHGSGTQIFSGANSYSGTTTIMGGTLQLQGAAFTNTARIYSVDSGAVLDLKGSSMQLPYGNTVFSGNGIIRISSGNLINNTGSGRLINMNLGIGALIDIGVNSSLRNGGWQNITWTNNKASMAIANNATFDLWDGNNVTIDALSGSGSVVKNYGGGQTTILSIGINSGSGNFSGAISNAHGSVAVVKLGSGTQVFSGVNTYTGSTTVNAGTLVIDGNNSSSSQTIVAAGAVIGGSGTLGNTNINGSVRPGTLSQYSLSSIGTLYVNGILGLDGIADFDIDPTSEGPNFASDLVSVTGTVTYGGILNVVYSGNSSQFRSGMIFNLFDASAFSGNFYSINLPVLPSGLSWDNNLLNNGTLSILTSNDMAKVVPESSTLYMCIVAAVPLLRRRR